MDTALCATPGTFVARSARLLTHLVVRSRTCSQAPFGEVLDIPDGAWPRIHGCFVCLAPDALYVLLKDPA